MTNIVCLGIKIQNDKNYFQKKEFMYKVGIM